MLIVTVAMYANIEPTVKTILPAFRMEPILNDSRLIESVKQQSASVTFE